MDEQLPLEGQTLNKDMGVHVRPEQDNLEKNETGSPDGRGPAEPREQLLSDDEFELEKEERSKENRGGEKISHSFTDVHIHRDIAPMIR